MKFSLHFAVSFAFSVVTPLSLVRPSVLKAARRKPNPDAEQARRVIAVRSHAIRIGNVNLKHLSK